MESKYHNGDTVKIIDYGELVFDKSTCSHCTEVKWRDVIPSVIGKIGVIKEIVFANGIPLYAISGIPEKERWYENGQLKLV